MISAGSDTLVYIGVGSNIDRERHTKVAIQELTRLDNELRVSPIYQCEPVGFDSGLFFNFVVELKTDLGLTQLSQALRQIEVKWGRNEDAKKFSDRAIDLDILLFGTTISTEAPLVPRKDIYQYPFVIQPLYDLNPELIIPNDGRTVADIWQAMDNLDSLTQVDLQR